MKQLVKSLAASALLLASGAVLAKPSYLTINNTTDVESNAFLAGKKSDHPTAPKTTSKVSWFAVQMVCYGHIDSANRCHAIIYMDTQSKDPIELGEVTLEMTTGDIQPKVLRKNGYTMTVSTEKEATATLTYQKPKA